MGFVPIAYACDNFSLKFRYSILGNLMKILCLATTSSGFAAHNYRELTILKSLQLRGADVDYYQCDCNGLVCWVFPFPSPQKKLPKVCRRCSRSGRERAGEVGLEVKSISSFFTQEICDKAKKWAASLDPENFAQAKYGEYDLGRWMFFTIVSIFRLTQYRPGNRNVDGFYRLFLEDSLRRALALEQLLDTKKYDRILIFNGRVGANKITLEVAKLRGIPVFVHEVGWSKETAAINVDELAVTLPLIHHTWDNWKDIPLTKREIEDAALYQFQRELGNESTIGWGSFATRTNESAAKLRKRLGIAPEKHVWALFPSSMDEIAADPMFRDDPDVTCQYQWIEDVLAAASRYPHVHLVIRVHPNMARNIWNDAESKADLDWFKGIKERGLENVTVIDAEENFSSYDLMDMATVGIAFLSTCSLEIALRGKHGCQASSHHGSSVEGATDSAPDREALEKYFAQYSALRIDEKSVEIQRIAFRFFNSSRRRTFFPFPLVKMTGPLSGVLASSFSVDDLRPGRDRGLDTICEAMLAGVRPENLPTKTESMIDTSTESEMFQQVIDIHELGRRICLERGEYLIPANSVIGFIESQGVSSAYCLTGWRQETDWYRKINGTKATLAFSCRESAPTAIQVRWIVARNQKVVLMLNDHALGSYIGTGWMQSVSASVPPGALQDLNFLTISMPEPKSGTVINNNDKSMAAVQAIWFNSPEHALRKIPFTELCGGVLASGTMYGVLLNRWRRKRF